MDDDLVERRSSWKQYQIFVLSELKHLSKSHEDLALVVKDIANKLDSHSSDISNFKGKVAVIASIASLLISLFVQYIFFLVAKY